MHGIRDVAQAAGVSRSTVSRALSGKGRVSPATRRRVKACAEQMGYEMIGSIQEMVLQRRFKKTERIAFVMARLPLIDPAYNELVDAVLDAAQSRLLHLILIRIAGDEKNAYDLPAILRNRRVDGILLTGDFSPGLARVMEALPLPVVVLGQYDRALIRSLPSVGVDVDRPIRDMIGEMKRRGRKRIAFVDEWQDILSARLALAAYRAGLREAGLPARRSLEYLGKGRMTGMLEAMRPVFRRAELPFDAIIAPDKRIALEMAFLIHGYAQATGRPEPLLGTGGIYHSSPLAHFTIFRQSDYNEVARVAVEQVMRLKRGETVEREITL